MKTLLVINPDGTTVATEFEGEEPALKDLQLAVGGFIEHIRVRYDGKIRSAYVNDEGVYKALPLNRYATRMASEFGYGPIVGPVAIIVPGALVAS